jgi:SAM-dependent methyltransferase
MKDSEIRQAVRDRYGSIAREEVAGCGCGCECGPELTALTVSQTVGYTAEELANAPGEANLGLGCGNPTALAGLKEGETVLDLGSGGGIDCFLASKQVGPTGKVMGVDMTPDMIERARKAAEAGGFGNVEFRLGEIEALPVPDGCVDAIISNCVLNLSAQRHRVYSEVMRVLKPGGRIMISDMISALPTPPFLLESKEALVGCLPVQEDEYLGGLRKAGLVDVKVVEEKPYPTELLTSNPAAQAHLKDHPEEEEEILAFVASMRGGLIQGFKPE